LEGVKSGHDFSSFEFNHVFWGKHHLLIYDSMIMSGRILWVSILVPQSGLGSASLYNVYSPAIKHGWKMPPLLILPALNLHL
jgi:hypothetical protein